MILSNRSRALIFGAMPFAHSFSDLHYYANPQNFFWLLMKVIGVFPPADLRYISLSIPVLSSTNSANAGMMRAQKIVEWNRLALYGGGGEK